MSLSYFNVKKFRRQSKQPETDAQDKTSSHPVPTASSPKEEPAASPVLDEEDERFLQRLAALSQEPEGTPPPLPDRPVSILDEEEKPYRNDAQEALMVGADKVPLPMSPPGITVEDSDRGNGKEKESSKSGEAKKGVMSYFDLAQSKFKRSNKEESNVSKLQKDEKARDKSRIKAADDLHSAAEAAKSVEQKEVEKEEQDLTAILDQLNLAAVNNRVFSFSKESEELLNKFKLVLKDLVNGVPTAYNDLEKLLTDSDAQMKKMYSNLPPFLQNLIKSLPAKMTAALGPELLAAQAEKPGFDGQQRDAASGKKKSKSKRARIPSLKRLLSAEGAVATMLKSILNFLKLRFPALMTGTNVLLSLAVFLLLFVFWYCHKRGRETRLEKEGLAAQEADSALASGASSFTDEGVDPPSASTKAGPSDTQQRPEKVDGPAVETGVLKESDLPSVSQLPSPGTTSTKKT